ncbi:MAG: response regulator [Opitutaceae bacterium]|jgi:CheY-like chemotaxis protein
MTRILLIEDDDAYQAMLRSSLEDRGHEVSVSNDGHEGINSFKSRKFDLVITDILMPKKDGVETIMELRAIDPAVRIIVISGGGHMIRAQNCVDLAHSLGIQSVLEKPFRVDDLQSCIAFELEKFAIK